MDEFNNVFQAMSKKEVNKETNSQQEMTVSTDVVEYKFLLLFTLYPNGKLYPRIVPIGQNTKANKKPKVKKKEIQQEIVDEEVY